MYRLTLENEFHSQIELTGHEDKWQVTNVTGLNPPPAVISTSVIPNFDGERFNASRLDKRNIVISFVINGDVERNRTKLYTTIFPKRYIKVYYKTPLKNVYIEGYVESFECDNFSQKCVGQISIICPKPYFMAAEASTVTFNSVVDLFTFPFSLPKEGIAISEMINTQTNSVINYGSVETGIEIEIEARHNVVDPSIMNLSTGETMTIRQELNCGDRILIGTNQGNKYVKLDCNCVESNLINSMTEDSKWIRLIPGENRFSYSAAYGVENIDLTIKHRDLFGGV